MLHGPAARALLAGALVFVPAAARAQALPVREGGSRAEPGAAPSPAASATGALAQPAMAPAQPAVARGAVVVAVGDGATQPARALARAIYRDAALRPALDDAFARVLIGEAPASDAPAAVKELAEARRSVAESGSDVVARRLLASLGAQAQAEVVVAVSMQGGRPVARVLRVATASYAPLELGATIRGLEQPAGAGPQAAATGAAMFEWPGATATLRAQLSGAGSPGKPAAGQVVGPLAHPARGRAPANATAAERGEAQGGEVWRSPWFWGAIGAVAAVGITVFVLAKTSEGDADTVHLAGRIAP
jgi:hypothetical protein